ncbi:hypothetical protein ASE90_08135 [Sphingomonas sp. Leaf67]|uniref:hypothetical protein n=1 Tax=unclassified Sphingomonas TaxID=196159 RepID=UPI0006F4EA32|nr:MULTISPECIES: hypothetical protein [unclassified Sphingomonas]KQN70998.1 hypothetical protein ASE91_07505 [Sphingomonas sp. Leaf62]KQN83878.1 hypothetical protein ASE90_08135 [Sphingomonas sp. Leaf67]
MSIVDNAEYYRRRLGETRTQAESAQLPEVRRVHREMAERYSMMLQDAERGNIARPTLGIVPRD